MINSCGAKCIKYFLAFFNFIFFAGGLVLAGFGKYRKQEKGKVAQKNKNYVILFHFK